jgi:hypothetical protein
MLGWEVNAAISTALFLNLVTALVATIVLARNRLVEFRFCSLILPGTILRSLPLDAMPCCCSQARSAATLTRLGSTDGPQTPADPSAGRIPGSSSSGSWLRHGV